MCRALRIENLIAFTDLTDLRGVSSRSVKALAEVAALCEVASAADLGAIQNFLARVRPFHTYAFPMEPRFPTSESLYQYRDEQLQLLRERRITRETFRRRIRKAVKDFNQHYDQRWKTTQEGRADAGAAGF